MGKGGWLEEEMAVIWVRKVNPSFCITDQVQGTALVEQRKYEGNVLSSVAEGSAQSDSWFCGKFALRVIPSDQRFNDAGYCRERSDIELVASRFVGRYLADCRGDAGYIERMDQTLQSRMEVLQAGICLGRLPSKWVKWRGYIVRCLRFQLLLLGGMCFGRLLDQTEIQRREYIIPSSSLGFWLDMARHRPCGRCSDGSGCRDIQQRAVLWR
jgi:hypothetical protein